MPVWAYIYVLNNHTKRLKNFVKGNNMKDYIYLDQELVNSTLAQIDNGLNTKMSATASSTETSNDESSTASKSNFEGGFPGVLKASIELSSAEKKSNGFTAGQSEMIDTILHDSAVDLMMEKLSDQLIENPANATNGNYIHALSSYRIYDFDLISKVTGSDYAPTFANLDSVKALRQVELDLARARLSTSKDKKAMLLLLDARKKELENQIYGSENETFNDIHQFTKMANALLPNTIFIRTESAAILGDKKNFRINSAQIQTIANLDRKIHIIGIVTGIQKETHADGEFEELKNQELNMIPGMMIDVLLASFDLLKENDRFIKPIAIFFE